MALRFFRRHQKMIFVIMVLLMVSFLVGFQGFSSFFQRKPGDIIAGRLADGTKLRQRDLWTAEGDLRILRNLGFEQGFQWQGRTVPLWPMSYLEFSALGVANQNIGPKQVVAYALLLKEAEAIGIKVKGAAVENFLVQSGWKGQRFQQAVSVLRQRVKVAEKDIRAALARWLMVDRSLSAGDISSPPSEAELRLLYRNLAERINLLVVRMPAEQFIADLGEPGEQDILSQFQTYRAVPLGNRYPEVGSFGFSYRQPPRVRITHLFVRQEVIEWVTDVSEETARDYYQQHKADYQTPEPRPAAAPAPGPTDPAETQPTQYRTVQKSYHEVRSVILEKLKAQRAAARLVKGKVDNEEQVAARVEELINRFDADPEAARRDLPGRDVQDAYEYALARMQLPAEEILAAKVDAEMAKVSLRSAVERLQQAAGVRICYPWSAGDVSASPDLLVRLEAKGISLGEALDRITEQLKLPKLQWASCAGFEGVIFPVSGVEFFPVQLGRTERLERAELGEHPVLGHSMTDDRRALSMIAFSAEEFRPPGAERVGGVKAGFDGPRMRVLGMQNTGRLLWRLAEAVPGYVPQELTDDIRKQVAKDLKTRIAFQAAADRAEKIRAAAAKVGLADAAKDAEVEAVETDLFSRVDLDQGKVAALPSVPRVWLLVEHVIESVFAMAPEDVEPPYADRPLAVKVIPLPEVAVVLVVQRIDYEPVVQSMFHQTRAGLEATLMAQRRFQTIQVWFRLENIVRRLGYREERVRRGS